jgi:hypothetical protein
MRKFREMENLEGEHRVNNFRPSQKTNERTIFYRSSSGCEIPQYRYPSHLFHSLLSYLLLLNAFKFN